MSIYQQKKDINVCFLLKEERKRLNLNQKDIADFLDMSVKQISRWESTIAIPTDKLVQLRELDFDVNYIISGERNIIDEKALQVSIEIVEEALEEIGKLMSAQKKAQLIAVIYEEYVEQSGQITPVQVARHLRLVV